MPAPTRPPAENAAWNEERILRLATLLERDALRVDGDVDRSEAGTEAEERGGEPGEAGRERCGEAASRRRAGAPASVMLRLPTRSHSRPATGIATSAPSEAANSARPSRAVVRPAWCWTAGIRAGPGADHSPSPKKNSPIARRVARICLTPRSPGRRATRYGSRSTPGELSVTRWVSSCTEPTT